MAGIEKSLPPEPNSDLWTRLRRFTPARIGLGRAGSSLPTRALLDFELAHARARDAVHAEFNAESLARQLEANGFAPTSIVSSQARARMEYLLRPDLGRALDPQSREQLLTARSGAPTVAIVIADGLSALSPQRHAIPLLHEMRSAWHHTLREDWENVTVVVANRARVALGDQIGAILGAQAVVVLIGERPGLSSPDSLGIYLTWAPRPGRTDADRNCISNVRPQGLPTPEAASRLLYLLAEARRLQRGGLTLKDDSDESPDPRLASAT